LKVLQENIANNFLNHAAIAQETEQEWTNGIALIQKASAPKRKQFPELTDNPQNGRKSFVTYSGCPGCGNFHQLCEE
jgi:hypothetical protein